MTQVEVLGWRHLPWQKRLHYFKRRKGMVSAVSACWLVSPVKSLKVDDDKPKCGLCEIMLAYHSGEDWLEPED